MPESETNKEFSPETQEELAAWLKRNSELADPIPVCAVGGRTAMKIGYPLDDDELNFVSLSGMNQLVEYPSRDMTITVQAGMTVGEFQQLLAAENQQLPVDLPFPSRSTIGGTVATNWSGSRRFGYGTLRDYLIGFSAVDSAGRSFKAGGRVVKNVAGYDLCKLMVGSLGTLAIATQLTFKTKPIPADSRILWCSFSTCEAVDRVFERLVSTQARPVSMDVLNAAAVNNLSSRLNVDLSSAESVLAIGVEGEPQDVQWQLATLRNEIQSYEPTEIAELESELTRQVYQGICEFGRQVESALVFKASMLPSKVMSFVRKANTDGVSVVAHAGDGIVIGQLSEEDTTLKQAESVILPLREMAENAGGHLFLVHCDSEWKRQLRLMDESNSSYPLMQKLKRQFDPKNILSPGRLIDGPQPV